MLPVQMSADVARGHGGDGGGEISYPHNIMYPPLWGCLGNRGKGTRKPNLGGRRAGRPHTRQETRNLGLKAITDKSGPVPNPLLRLQPSLTLRSHMESDPAGHNICGHPAASAKDLQWQEGCSQGRY
ncbi:hypothetical protein Tco_0462552 [Tanacetum coccineum]